MVRLGSIACAGVALGLAGSAQATWSICLADCETKEVAVGTVTCLNNFDLLALVPVVVVGKGSGACQSAGDFDGIRRPIIFDGLMNGDSPAVIFAQLEQITGHQQRQYGIVDTNGQMLSFTGSANGQWAGSITGAQGSMVYAIQGNVLAGECVLNAIEQAILGTGGDMAAKLMAGMQAAKDNGGDGRCSCNNLFPTICGCPPEDYIPDVDKSGHIGGVIVARVGDTDDGVCDAEGCTDGSYFMRLNVPFQSNQQPDPVVQLKALYAGWRASLVGRPDAIRSTVEFDPGFVPSNGAATTQMTITLLDWQGLPITAPIDSVSVTHAPDSAGIAAIGAATDMGGGVWTAPVTAGSSAGIDRYRVTVTEAPPAEGPPAAIILAPDASFEFFPPGDTNGDGDVDITDFLTVLGTWGPCADPCPPYCSADFNADCEVGIEDFLVVIGNWTL